MKRKILLLLVILSSLFICTACTSKPTQDNIIFNFDFVEYIGLPYEESLIKMELTENDLIARDEHGLYAYVDSITYNDYAFTKYLTFGTYNGHDNALYGGGYEYFFDETNETCITLIKELKEQLVKQYGEPTTYPGLSNTIDNLKNVSDCTDGASFGDTWAIDGNTSGTIALTITLGPSFTEVQMEYRVAATK